MKLVRTFTMAMLLGATAVTVFAQRQAVAQAAVKTTPATGSAALSWSDGVILKLYPKEQKILLKHGPIPSIGMGPMTMEYELANPKLLRTIKAGDKVRFTADQVKDQYVVTHIELAK